MHYYILRELNNTLNCKHNNKLTMEYKAKYTVKAVQWNGEITPEIEELFNKLLEEFEDY